MFFFKKYKQAMEITRNMLTAFRQSFNGLYVIDTEKDTVQSLIHSTGQYKYGTVVRKYSDYLKKRIVDGTVAPESIATVEKLLQEGYIDAMASEHNFELDFKLRLHGKTEYAWYVDTFIPMPHKAHTYLLTRRDVTAIYAEREKTFAYEESLRLAEHDQAMLDSMAGLVEFRNKESGQHIQHVRTISHILMDDISKSYPQYEMSPQLIDLYTRASIMHDVGKITISDAILNKPDVFTHEEYEQMKKHTTGGADVIRSLNMPGMDELKACCYEVALHHHERWDGSGYPDGLVGDECNIYVQAIAMADVYDALVNERCYKHALSHKDAVQMIIEGKSGAFNPRIIECLKRCSPQIKASYA